MPISSLADLRTAYSSAPRISAIKVGAWGGVLQRYYGMIWDYFDQAGNPIAGVAPTTLAGTQYSKSSAGAMQLNTTAGSTYALADVQTSAYWEPIISTGFAYPGGSEFVIHVWDRVWANVVQSSSTSRQSWTFPALTRYTTGAGLSLWLKTLAYHTPANCNVTIEYVNQDGVSRTHTTFQYINSLLYFAPPSMLPLPLATGDSGVRSVSAITFSVGHGTANAAGLCLMRYLGSYRVGATSVPDSTAPLSVFGGLPQFDGDACLTLGVQPGPPPPPLNAVVSSSTIMPQIGFEAKVLAL
jgi:hypothetical protein